MAKFDGFVCDVCKTPRLSDVRHVEVVQYQGPEVSGQYKREMCDDCALDMKTQLESLGIVLSPLRRRPRLQTAKEEGDVPEIS